MRRTGDDECRDVLVLMVGAIWWQGAVLSVFVRGGIIRKSLEHE